MSKQETDEKLAEARKYAPLHSTEGRATRYLITASESMARRLDALEQPPRLGPPDPELIDVKKEMEKLAGADSKQLADQDTLEARAGKFAALDRNDCLSVDYMLVEFAGSELARIKDRVMYNVLWEIRRENLRGRVERILVGAVERAFALDPPGPPSPPVPPRDKPVS